jgi:mRNA interferase RelE/StbE
MSWNLKIKKNVLKKVSSLDLKIRERIAKILELMKEDPYVLKSKKLKGFDNIYRVRIGNIRVVYQLLDNEKTIEILKIDFRGKVYKNL